MDKNQKWLKTIPQNIGSYLAGFSDGEGSFNVSLRKRDDHTLGWQIVAMFNVSQRDQTVLALFKRHLGCGKLWQRKDGVWYYIVSNPTSIKERVIPFFSKFPFLSSTKKTNFSLFQKIVSIMEANEHLTQEGMRKIVMLREELNKGRGRKRKYTVDHYNHSLAENPQRLHAKAQPREKRPEKVVYDIVRSHGRP